MQKCMTMSPAPHEIFKEVPSAKDKWYGWKFHQQKDINSARNGIHTGIYF